MPGMWGTSMASRKSTVVNQQLFLSNKVAQANDIQVDPVTGVTTNNSAAFFNTSNVVFEDLLTTPETIVGGNLFVGGIRTPGSTGYTVDVSGTINAKQIYVNGLAVGTGTVDLTSITNRLGYLETSSNKVDISLGVLNTRANNVDNSITSLTTRANNVDNSITSLTTRANNVDNSITSLTTRANRLDTSVNALTTRVTNVEENVSIVLNKTNRLSYNSLEDKTYLYGNIQFQEKAPISNFEPTEANHLATKNYVDSNAGTALLNTDNSWNGLNKFNRLTAVGDVSFAGNVYIDPAKILSVGQLNATNLVISGTTTTVDTTDLKVKDKLVTLNVGGGAVAGSHVGSGIEVEGFPNQIVANLYLDADGAWTFRNVGASADKILGKNALQQDDLALSGNLSVGKKLSVIGDVSMGANVLVLGNVQITQKLLVSQDVSFNRKMFVLGDASINGNLTVIGDVSLNKKVTIASDASLNGEVGILGNLRVANDVAVTKNLLVTQDASLNRKLFVLGDASFNGNLAVGGDVSLNKKVTIANDVSLNGEVGILGNLRLAKDVIVSQNLLVVQDASLNRKLFVAGNTLLNGNINVVGDTSLNGGLAVAGASLFITLPTTTKTDIDVSNATSNTFTTKGYVTTEINRVLSSSGGANLSANNVFTGLNVYTQDLSLNAKLIVGTDISLGGKLRAVGDASFNGEVGILGNLQVANDVAVTKNLLVTLDASLNRKLFVLGDASFNGNVAIGGDVSLNKKVTVASDASLNGEVGILGNLRVAKDVAVTQNLLVTLDASLNRKLFVLGDSSFNGNVAVGGDVSLNKKVTIAGDASLNGEVGILGNLRVANDVAVTKNLLVTLDASLNRKLFVLGDASFNGNVAVGGDVSLNKKVTVASDTSLNGEVGILGNLRVTKDVAVTQNLLVTLDASLNRKLFVSGDASFNGNVAIGGDVSLNKKVTIAGDISMNSHANVFGNLRVGDDVHVAHKLFVTSDITASADIEVIGKMMVGGDASFNANFDIAGNLELHKTMNAKGDISLNGNLAVAGTSLFITLPTTTKTVTDVSNATSNTFVTKGYVTTEISRVLSSSGGANLAANNEFTGLNVFTQDLSLNAKLSVGTDISLGGKLRVVGDASLNGEVGIVGNLQVAKDAAVSQNLLVIQDASLNRKLFVSGDVSFNGNAVVGGDVSLNKKVTIASDASLNGEVGILGNVRITKDINVLQKMLVSGDASLNSRLYVGGDSSFNGNLSISGKNFNFVEGFASGNVTVTDTLFATNLQISGTTTQINTTNMVVNDNIITLNKGAPNLTNSSGIEVESGGSIAGNVLLKSDGIWYINSSLGESAIARKTALDITDVSLATVTSNLATTTSNLATTTSNLATTTSNLVNTDVSVNSALGKLAQQSYADATTTIAGNVTLTDANSRLVVIGDVSLNRKFRVNGDASFAGNVLFSRLPITTITNFSSADGNAFVTKNYVTTTTTGILSDSTINTLSTSIWDNSKITTTVLNSGFQDYTVSAMSSNGKYVTISKYINGYSAPTRMSSNNGIDFTSPFGNSLQRIESVAMSADGKYQYIGTHNYLARNANYGIGGSWTTSDTLQWAPANTNFYLQILTVSSSGKYVFGIGNSNNGLDTSINKVFLSSDYGFPFSSYRELNGTGGLPNLDVKLYGYPAMSYSGQVLCINTNNAFYVSTDFGSTWKTVTTSGTIADGISMSSSGQFIAIVKRTTTSGAGLLFSSDYGVSFNVVNAATNLSKCAVSASGQNIVVTDLSGNMLVSNDYGVSWTTFSASVVLWTDVNSVAHAATPSITADGRSIVVPTTSGIRGYTNVLITLTNIFNSDASFSQQLNVVGNTTLANVFASTLVLTSDASLNGKLSVGSDVSLAGDVLFSKLPLTTITDFSSADNNAFVTKSYVAGLTSSGASTVADNVFTGKNTFTKDLSLNANVFVGADISLAGKLTAYGNVVLDKNLNVNGNATVSNTLFVSNINATNLTVVGTTTTLSVTNLDICDNIIRLNKGAASVPLTGSGIEVESGGSVAGNLVLKSDGIWYMGNTSVVSAIASASALSQTDVSANAALGKLTQQTYTSGTNTTAITGNVVLADASSKLVAIGDVSFNTKLIVGSDVSFNGKLNVVGTTTLAAASATTLLASSDVSLGTKLYVGGDVSLNAKLNVAGDASFGNVVATRMLITNDVSLNAKLNVAGDASFGNVVATRMLITNDVSLNAKLNVAGDASFGNVVATRMLITNDVSLNAKLNVAGDASFGNVVATRMLIAGDVSINTSKFFVGGDASFGGSIITLNGNVQLGNGTRNVAINKVPGTTFALDVSGTTQMTGNVSIVKNPSDASYSFLDLTSVNLNLFGVAEKFVTGTTPAATLTFNCANGTIFEVSGVASGTRPTSISFTNVPNTVGRSVSITVILYKSTSNTDAYYYDQTSVNVNGASITLQRPDGAAYTNPTASVATHIHQFVIMWRSSTPTVFMYTSSLG